jgi:hypothetical protein
VTARRAKRENGGLGHPGPKDLLVSKSSYFLLGVFSSQTPWWPRKEGSYEVRAERARGVSVFPPGKLDLKEAARKPENAHTKGGAGRAPPGGGGLGVSPGKVDLKEAYDGHSGLAVRVPENAHTKVGAERARGVWGVSPQES